MTRQNSDISGFYKKSCQERLAFIKKFAQLSDDEVTLLKQSFDSAAKNVTMSAENIITFLPIHLGIATNFIVNKKDVLVPMATEEPSVIAGACYAAKLARLGGGFQAVATEPIMIGQLLLVGVSDVMDACKKIEKVKNDIFARANAVDAVLVSLGGGACDIELKCHQTSRGPFLVVLLLVNVKDAMGANIVNSMLEVVAPFIERIVGGVARAKIVSNLSLHRMVKARGVWDKNLLGADVIQAILDVYEFACVDPFRAVTHNKGIMNGIDAVALATGNDFRALEAGAHGFASLNGSYQPLTKYYLDGEKNLVGELEIPLAAGIVGGATRSNPITNVCLKILQVNSAAELAEIMASVGLAQNFAALRALACEGIQKGHMRLHSKNVAIGAGVPAHLVDDIAQQMVADGCISYSYAQELIKRRLG